MALSRLNYNSLNVTPTASKGIGFDSGADDLSIDFAGGDMVFIKKLTSGGSDATLDFVDGTSDVVLDSTYKEYMFILNNIHPETANADFMFQANAAGGSGYNETITSSMFQAYHTEGDTAAALDYESGDDLAQATTFQQVIKNCGGEDDDGGSGYLHLFNPSSTTFVKHFIAWSGAHENTGDYYANTHTAGYFNTTSAIDEIQFKMSTGETQAGTISLYGIN